MSLLGGNELYLDLETRCETPLRNGSYRYAESVEITVAAWAWDEDPVTVEDLTVRAMSQALKEAIATAPVIVMHNGLTFDRVMLAQFQINIPVGRIHDTAVQARAHGLPAGLDKLCAIFQIPTDEAKDKAGAQLIQLFCKPRPKNHNLRWANRQTHPVEWQRFLDYAGTDITAMRAIKRKMPTWNYPGREIERRMLALDQTMNDRGFQVDEQMVKAAIDAVAKEQVRLKKAVREITDHNELTGDGIGNARSRKDVLFYLCEDCGVPLPDLKKDTLERRLEDPELPEHVKQVIRIRLAATTSSTAKYPALARSVCSDWRLRGSVLFRGAARTGRRSGRLFQPQNLPRPNTLADEIEDFIEALKGGYADLAWDIMPMSSDALRGVIVAPPGKKILSSDLSNIEGRIAAWLSGETWKLQAFKDYDTKVPDPDKPGKTKRLGHDLYALAYAKSFGVSPEAVMANYKAGGDWRQVGKVQELALGYEGGVGAFIAFAEVYRLDLEEMAAQAYPLLPYEARVQAEIMLGWTKKKKRTTFGLSDRAYVVIESFKALWRSAHPQTSTYWKELEKAAIRAIKNPGVTVEARRLKFRRKGAWLRMILPSGRSLCYASPQVDDKGSISYMGVNQYTRRWQRLHTYGGKLFENACQAVAADVMMENELEIEAAGFEVVLDVHDDVICEADADNEELTIERLSALLSRNPAWLPGCPLSASGFEAQRYKKD